MASSLPSGTVTILFTYIAGRTGLAHEPKDSVAGLPCRSEMKVLRAAKEAQPKGANHAMRRDSLGVFVFQIVAEPERPATCRLLRRVGQRQRLACGA
jgi:hypothetical protein